MTADLTGKVAIVTGGSSGIGRQTAETLAARGAMLVVNYPTPAQRDDAQAVVNAISGRGGQAVAVQADVTSLKEIDALFDAAGEAFGGQLDIVVSNAGGTAGFRPIADTDEAYYDAGMALNAKSNFFVMKRAARDIADGGRIIVTASTTTALAFAGSSVYAGGKAAAEIFVRVLAKELGPRGVTVNAVSPGLTDTPAMREAGQVEERLEMARRLTPLGRLGRPDDIADVIAFLASEEARWITGQNIRAGGGVV